MDKQQPPAPQARKPQGYSKDAQAPDALPNTKVMPAPLKAPPLENVNLGPADDDGKTEMIAPVKGVRIRANAAIAYDGITMAPGDEAEVSEEMAAEFCDRKFQGAYSFGGERGNGSAERHIHARATRLT